MANLEPDVLLGQGARRVRDDVLKALQTLVELLLLLVDYAESEIDFVGLLKIGGHAHDLGEGFFGVVEGSITVVKDTNAVPQLGFLQNAVTG